MSIFVMLYLFFTLSTCIVNTPRGYEGMRIISNGDVRMLSVGMLIYLWCSLM